MPMRDEAFAAFCGVFSLKTPSPHNPITRPVCKITSININDMEIGGTQSSTRETGLYGDSFSFKNDLWPVLNIDNSDDVNGLKSFLRAMPVAKLKPAQFHANHITHIILFTHCVGRFGRHNLNLFARGIKYICKDTHHLHMLCTNIACDISEKIQRTIQTATTVVVRYCIFCIVINVSEFDFASEQFSYVYRVECAICNRTESKMRFPPWFF